MAQENVEAPMTGKIMSVEVKPGDQVKDGDVICILESMKMENPIVATAGGRITKVGVVKDQVVKSGDVIAVIEY